MSRSLYTFAVALLVFLPIGYAHDGPHGGILYCNAKHTHHAEFCLDTKTGTATIYVLDNRAQKEVAVEAKSIPVVLKGYENSKLEFAAVDAKNGKASKFVLKHDRFKNKLKPSELKIYILLEPGKALVEFIPEHEDD